MKIFVTYHKKTPIIQNKILTPIHAGKALSSKDLGMIGDNTGENISTRNPNWCELTVQYWMWKNVDTDFYGLFHYRRLYDFNSTGEPFFFDTSTPTIHKFGWEEETIKEYCKGYDIIMPPQWAVHQDANYNNLISIYEFYKLDHIQADMDIALKIIEEKYPDYLQSAKIIMRQKKAYYCNMFIMSKPLFHQYSKWLFDILFEVEKRIIIDQDNSYQKRVFGFLSERLINVFIFQQLSYNNNLRLKEAEGVPMGIFDGKYPYGYPINDKPLWEKAGLYAITGFSRIKKPKISVIVPVYNVEKYLAACLNSIVNQSFKEIEILIVNDGSTDSSQAIIDQYQQVDKRIISFQKTNGGLSSARNLGLKHAQGDYIIFIDSDDYYFVPTALSRLYDKACSQELEVVMFPTKVVDANTEQEVLDIYYNDTHLPRSITKNSFTIYDIKDYIFTMQVSAWNKLYKRELITRTQVKFFEGLCFEDNPFFLEIIFNAKKMGVINEQFYAYRINRENSILTGRADKYFDFIPIANLCQEILQKHPLWEQVKYNFWDYKITSIYHWYSQIAQEFKEKYYKQMKSTFLNYNLSQFDMNKIPDASYKLFVSVLDGSAKNGFIVVPYGIQEVSPSKIKKSFTQKLAREVYRIPKALVKWFFALMQTRRTQKKLDNLTKENIKQAQKIELLQCEIVQLKDSLEEIKESGVGNYR